MDCYHLQSIVKFAILDIHVHLSSVIKNCVHNLLQLNFWLSSATVYEALL
jgi:hypothetical protein